MFEAIKALVATSLPPQSRGNGLGSFRETCELDEGGHLGAPSGPVVRRVVDDLGGASGVFVAKEWGSREGRTIITRGDGTIYDKNVLRGVERPCRKPNVKHKAPGA